MNFKKIIEDKYECVARVSRTHEHLGITYLYPARGGASVAIAKKSDNTYWVLLFKSNKVISAQLLHHIEKDMDAQKMLVALMRYAGEKGFLKKNMPSVTPKELAALLLKKEGLSLSTFHRLFPDLKDASIEDAVDVGGMKILHSDVVRNSAIVMKAIEKGITIVKDAGFNHLIYGEVFLLGSAMKADVAADYDRGTDQIRFKTNVTESAMVHNLIHELGHRQYYKFKVDEAENNAKFNEVVAGRQRLRVGDIVKDPKDGAEYTVVAPLYVRGNWKYKVSFGEGKRGTAGDFIENWQKVNGEQDKKNIFDVSGYAKTRNTEFWAEVFATALVTKNPDLMAWVRKVTRK